MSAVSDWIQTCDYFYPPLHHQNQEPQQPIYNVDVHAQNKILLTPYQAYHGFPSHNQQLQDTSNSSLLNLMSMDANTGPLSCLSEPSSQVLDVHVWSQLNAQHLNVLDPALVPAVSQPVVSSSLNSINEQQQELLTVLDSWTRLFHPAVSPSLASSSSNAPSPSPSSVYTSFSSLPGTPLPTFSSPPPFLTANASSYPLPPTSEYLNTYKTLSHKFAPRTSSILTRRQSQALALEAALACKDSSAPSAASSPSSAFQTSSPPSSSSSSSSSPLVCQVCKKHYANSSTLRRHLKIHAYANSAARSLSSSRSVTPFSDNASQTALDVETRSTSPQEQHEQQPQQQPHYQESYLMMPLICTGVPTLSFSDDVTSSLPSSSSSISSPSSSSSSSSLTPLIQGYNPCSDPDIKKPECVGCNKAFARRDTVILHIKNQKRKWDLLNALLPTLASTHTAAAGAAGADGAMTTTAMTGPSSLEGLDMEGMHLITKTHKLSLSASNTSGGNGGGGGGGQRRRGGQKHRRTHPYRMVEKLWQSTMQRKGVHLACNANHNHNNNGNAHGGEDHAANKVKVELGDEEGSMDTDLSQAIQDEAADETDDGWPSRDALAQMDSQAKLQWMMKMMVLPPCWKERKVRLFGAFGVLEEKVLQ
ncbi:hypothetical protein BGZ70_007888 [Mortierella alpina]|uniref:C2H2-type domain-containing protein n=1 Tax=Mortierella alpina TaxID=64518 RepID=A0A9P6J4T4_MORAP|nr:hypothetical protein BGZ70_007888 [Mortierella alpina]